MSHARSLFKICPNRYFRILFVANYFLMKRGTVSHFSLIHVRVTARTQTYQLLRKYCNLTGWTAHMSILLSDYEIHVMKLFAHIYYSLVALTTNGFDIKLFLYPFSGSCKSSVQIISITMCVFCNKPRQVNASEHWKIRRHPLTLVPCE